MALFQTRKPDGKEGEMVAIANKQKARLLDLATTILELVRDGNRDPEEVCAVLQIIKERPDFAKQLLGRTRQSLGRGEPSFLKKIDTITLPATKEPFVARQKFVVGKDPVNIARLGRNFEKWFLDKIEKPVEKTTLCYAELVRPAADRFILDELDKKAETTLAHIYALMERQPDGEDGILLTHRGTNIFYVRDVNGTLRSVLIDLWFSPGWVIDAVSVDSLHPWAEWDQVFFRNS